MKSPKLVTRAHLPSFISSKTQVMFGFHDVNGAAILASAWEREIPTFAALKAYNHIIHTS